MGIFIKHWKTPPGEIYRLYKDMLNQPHLLIGGTTGSGKSVLVNGLIYTALYQSPKTMEFIFVDPKRTELVMWRKLPHTIEYASEPGDMLKALERAMQITEERYKTMQFWRKKTWEGPHVYVIIDELADLMTTQKKAVTPIVQRIGQIGRAAGVHIIACTQCPTTAVIPTAIKVNFTARVGLRTWSKQDSRNILDDSPDCCNLPRYGKCIYKCPDFYNTYDVKYYPDAVLNDRAKHWIKQKGIIARYL